MVLKDVLVFMDTMRRIKFTIHINGLNKVSLMKDMNLIFLKGAISCLFLCKNPIDVAMVIYSTKNIDCITIFEDIIHMLDSDQ